MKWDWSKTLFTVMTLFIVMVVAMGIRMSMADAELYEEDYYDKGENYESRMELKKEAIHVSMKYDHGLKSLVLEFDSMGNYTQLSFKNLSDKSLDFAINEEDNTPYSSKAIPLSDLKRGIWMVECLGEVNGNPYFKKLEFTR